MKHPLLTCVATRFAALDVKSDESNRGIVLDTALATTRALQSDDDEDETPKITVRVWHDKNPDGLQNSDEIVGFNDIKLQLLDAKSKTRVSGQPVVLTNEEGIAVFKNVEQGKWYRVQVLTPPPGGKLTFKEAFDGSKPSLDSDLNSNGMSDSFKLLDGQLNFDTVDIGYRGVPTITVKVW